MKKIILFFVMVIAATSAFTQVAHGVLNDFLFGFANARIVLNTNLRVSATNPAGEGANLHVSVNNPAELLTNLRVLGTIPAGIGTNLRRLASPSGGGDTI